VHLYWSDRAEVPMVIGARRPRILVPARLQAAVEQGEFDLVLLHELAHVRRGDAWMRTLEAMVEALFVVNPFLRWIISRLAREREHCCDDIALGAGEDRLRYVRALTALELERSRKQGRAQALAWRFASATALHATDGALLERVRRLTGASKRAPRSRRMAAGVGVFLGSAGLTFGALPTHDARVIVAFHSDARASLELRLAEEPGQAALATPTAVRGLAMGQRKARMIFVARHSESGEADPARFLLTDEPENLRVRWLEDEDEDGSGLAKTRLIRVEAFKSVR
ncbi:MAG: M56 family metallopeptidase, partial [Planctomycetota bacterium]